jgi:hypothetical protein
LDEAFENEAVCAPDDCPVVGDGARRPLQYDQPTELEIPMREKHARLLTESVERTQAVYERGLQEATQNELDELEVQEALIAARKKELQAKLSK